MLMIILAVISLSVLGIGILGIYKYNDNKRGDWDVIGACGTVIGICLVVATMLTSLLIPISNQGNAARLVAFYESNAQNYGTAVQMTEDILTISLDKLVGSIIPVQGSIEKIDVGQTLSDRIGEYRTAVNKYNSDISVMRTFDGNPLLGLYFPTLPDYVVPIVIE